MNPFKIIGLLFLFMLICFLCTVCASFTFVTQLLESREIQLDLSKYSCTLNGKTYLKGESYFDGCNTCTCMGDGKPACTKKHCQSSSSSSIVTSDLANDENEICWNRAKTIDGVLAWPDGCKGITCTKQAVSLCTAAIEPLTEFETGIYKSWMVNDSTKKSMDCECYN